MQCKIYSQLLLFSIVLLMIYPCHQLVIASVQQFEFTNVTQWTELHEHAHGMHAHMCTQMHTHTCTHTNIHTCMHAHKHN